MLEPGAQHRRPEILYLSFEDQPFDYENTCILKNSHLGCSRLNPRYVRLRYPETEPPS